MELFKRGDFVVRSKEHFTSAWLTACEQVGASPESPRRVIRCDGDGDMVLYGMLTTWGSWCFFFVTHT